MGARPTGTVTFLFTDVEGSTALWEERPDAMAVALELHDGILRSSIDEHGGYVFSTAGDAFAAAFARAEDALAAARHAQAALGAATWPQETVIRVRMGVHTGEAQERDGDYFGPTLNRAARIMSAGHGGQVLVSAVTAAVRGHEGLVDVGAHRLKDLGVQQQLYQVGDDRFPALRSPDAGDHGSSVDRAPRVGRAGKAAELFEREEALADLHRALARARDGRGQVVLVASEAGSGKTTLLSEFQRQAAGRPAFLEGACDPVSTPRPLGPLIDAVGALDHDLAVRLAAGTNRAEAFAVAQSLVDGSRGDLSTVLTIEDVHWADEATLDLVTFLGRRIARTSSLLVLTYREDEVDAGHPLRARLGELGGAIGTRVTLEPLTRSAVASLVERSGADVDVDDLHRTTGGNPFFVTEILGARPGRLPVSVQEAVLARAERLPLHARTVLDAAAIVPGRVERWLMDAMTPTVDTSAGLEICAQRGLVHVDTEGTIGFRHELSQLGIASALAVEVRRELHERAFVALLEPPVGHRDDARLAHHAAEAGDAQGVLDHAPAAAAKAERMGAIREAERHYGAAIRFASSLEAYQRGDLHVDRARLRMRLSRSEDALSDLTVAIELSELAGDVDRTADATVRSAAPLSVLGRHPEAVAAVERAAAMVAGRPPSAAQARVSEYVASNHMLARRFAECEREAQRTIALAEEVPDHAILAHACINTGIALAMSGDDAGLDRVRRGMDIAEQRGDDETVATGHLQIGSGYGEIRRYDVAVPTLREGIAFADAREMPAIVHYESAWLGRCQLEVGNWDEAAKLATGLIRTDGSEGIGRFVALITLAWVRARRGDPEVAGLVDEALEFAQGTRLLQRLWPVAACRAEIAWMAGRIDDELALVAEASALAIDLGWAPAIEELAYWQYAADGETRGVAAHAKTPFGLAAAGHPGLAAARWAEVGCPYEEATARMAIGTAAELKAAVNILEGLGADPMRKRAIGMMRDAGITVPRGPTAS